MIGQQDVHRHAALFGELQGVAHEIQQHLPHTHRIADRPLWHRVVHAEGEAQPLLTRTGREALDHLGSDPPHIERHGRDLELSGVDLRHVEHVVDDRQQRVGRALHRIQVFTLLAGQRRFEREFRIAHDPVHWRADLVAHVGEELALGASARLRRFHRRRDRRRLPPDRARQREAPSHRQERDEGQRAEAPQQPRERPRPGAPHQADVGGGTQTHAKRVHAAVAEADDGDAGDRHVAVCRQVRRRRCRRFIERGDELQIRRPQ